MATRGEGNGGERGAALRPVPTDAGFHPVAATVSEDLEPAVTACQFPLIVWTGPDGTIRLANRAAAELIGVPLHALTGRSLFDLGLPRASAQRAVRGITTNEVDRLRSRLEIRRPDGSQISVWAWTRAIELDNLRGGVTLVTPVSDIARLGRDAVAPWRDLIPVAVGLVDSRLQIASVSADIREITGKGPAEFKGRSLLELIHPDDRARVLDRRRGPPRVATSWCHLRVQSRGGWTEGCVLLSPSPDDPGQSGFAVVGAPRPANGPLADRVAELEMRLRHIAAEVRAAGALEEVGALPSPRDIPELGELSSRQWEIVSRLFRGQRVPGIAHALYVSPSTVRNHLSTIFSKFGVHSQSELLERLHRRR